MSKDRANEAVETLEQLTLPPTEASPEQVLQWTAGQFGSRIALSCSFGGPGGMVLAHMVSQVAPQIPILFIDTGFLFPETIELRKKFATEYGLKVIDYRPQLSTAGQSAEFGDNLWEISPDTCCQIRKVEPMSRALEQLDAWITALRRDQSSTRESIDVVEKHITSTNRHVFKINPLAHWTRKEVWAYLLKHQVPYNPLLDIGYKSIGCIQCTTCVADNSDERAGRWAGKHKTECGLHTFTQTVP